MSNQMEMVGVAESRASVRADDEIDLVELFMKIWGRKWWVVAVTALTVCIALIYLTQTTPIYQARVHLMPPSASDIEALNYADAHLKNEYSVEEAYRDVLQQLQSRRQMLDFYRSNDLDRIYRTDPDVSEQRAFESFLKSLSVTLPKKGDAVFASVSLDGEDPEEITRLLNDYVVAVGKDTVVAAVNNLLELKDRTIKRYENEIASKRKLARLYREDSVERLNEAYAVAQSVGVKTLGSNVVNREPTGQNVNIISLDTLYMRGTDAIEAELEVLRNRKSDDHVISGLRNLQEGIEVLSAIEVDTTKLSPFQIDMAAEVPERPIKPKKMLVLALSMVLGGMLGVFTALIVPAKQAEIE